MLSGPGLGDLMDGYGEFVADMVLRGIQYRPNRVAGGILPNTPKSAPTEVAATDFRLGRGSGSGYRRKSGRLGSAGRGVV